MTGSTLPVVVRQIATFALALLGGFLFDLANVPLGWMIGALVFSALFSWGFAVSLPKRTRPMALVVLGASFGTAATPEIIAQVIERLPWMIMASLLTLCTGALLTLALARGARLNPRTAFFCAVPGGVTVMPVLAEAAGVDTRPVTLSQTIRMVLVVMLVPPAVIALGADSVADPFHATSTPVQPIALGLFLAASLLAAYVMKFARTANPWILGPLFLSIGISATLGAPSGFPHWMIALAQVAMGVGLGVKLNRSFVLGSTRLLATSAISTLVLGVFLGLLAAVLASASDLPLGAVLLGMAPGGTPEMVVTAATLEVSVPMVLAFHLVRMVASNLLISPMWMVVSKIPAFGLAGR